MDISFTLRCRDGKLRCLKPYTFTLKAPGALVLVEMRGEEMISFSEALV